MAGLAFSTPVNPCRSAVGSATPVSLFTPATERALGKAKPSLVAFDSQGTETFARHRRHVELRGSFEHCCSMSSRPTVPQRPRLVCTGSGMWNANTGPKVPLKSQTWKVNRIGELLG
jgi:hypothetical protein